MTAPGWTACTIDVVHGEGFVDVALHGELDAIATEDLRSCLTTLLDDGHRILKLDVSDLSRAEDGGLAVVLDALTRARLAGGDLIVSRPQRELHHQLDLHGLTELLAIEVRLPD